MQEDWDITVPERLHTSPRRKAAPLSPIQATSKAVPNGHSALAPGTVVQLRVWRCPIKNPTLVVAYPPDTDPENPLNLVNVRVRSNLNFLPGMMVKAAFVDRNTYDLVGACPRWRGRW